MVHRFNDIFAKEIDKRWIRNEYVTTLFSLKKKKLLKIIIIEVGEITFLFLF